MATIIFCDGGCGAQSPDPKTHLRIAHSWFTVRAWRPGEYRFSEPTRHVDKQFCKVCEPRIREALKPLRALTRGG